MMMSTLSVATVPLQRPRVASFTEQLYTPLGMDADDSHINWNANTLRRGVHSEEESIQQRSPMASMENKCKYTNEEEEEATEESMTKSKKRWVIDDDDNDDNDSVSSSSPDDVLSKEEVSSEEEPTR
jgi:hypothetical protein